MANWEFQEHSFLFMDGSMWRYLVFLVLVMANQSVFSQESYERENDEVASIADEERLSSLKEVLDQSGRTIFPVNRVNASELATLGLLTPEQIRQFIRFRETFGRFISLMELQAIPYWTAETARRMIPHLSLQENTLTSIDKKRLFKEGIQRILYRTGGTIRSAVPLPHAHKQLLSYRFNHREKVHWGITTEKDAGERDWLDYFSAYAAIKKTGLINQLVAGDFTVAMGQGLVHWQGYAPGRSGNIIQGYRQSALFKPHTGTDENRFYRGLALDLQKGNWGLALFASKKGIDANTLVDSVADKTTVSSLLYSGLHRTPSEINDKKSLQQLAWGGRISFSTAKGGIHLNAVHQHFQYALQKSSRTYNQFAIQGRNWQNFSADFGWHTPAGFIFGEVALDKNFQPAWITGILKSLHPRLDLSLVARQMSTAYRAVASNAITQNQEANNERGIFACINFSPADKHRLEAYADRYFNPWPVYGCDGPRRGLSHSTQYHWKPSKTTEFSLRYSWRKEDGNGSVNEQKTAIIHAEKKESIRLHLSVRLAPALTIRYRTERISLKKGDAPIEKGWLAYTELIIDPPMGKVSISARYALFDTESYDTRIYAYERDIPFYHSVPASYGNGNSSYLLINFKPFRNIQLSCKSMWGLGWRAQLVWQIGKA